MSGNLFTPRMSVTSNEREARINKRGGDFATAVEAVVAEITRTER
jgi:hypothetical protein